MGHVKEKTRSLGQILEKLCVCARGHMSGKKLGHEVKSKKNLVYVLEATFSV